MLKKIRYIKIIKFALTYTIDSGTYKHQGLRTLWIFV